MAASLRAEVLKCFRCLHRTRTKVFTNDQVAMDAARLKINSEFRKYQRISSQEAIAELIKLGHQAEEILRTSVVQVTPTAENTFRLHITKDTFMHNNTPYRG
ncbi:hypothetical protein DAPPUDRAFT_310790 [Daphnia pulex]|uniref:Complex III assembly factor LYRM7 n=1 Tax=Daphnia pulex TaxID=6669 RepID=E9FVI9_DAPPU|nr:hypothetical protein DAPPUDRAFT_310790 [Daphnia pulex]|eukprot:EFX88561.1 hypothetical protein DAPPUDRAFT_310790 [Daphnia pulex]